jgi:hypothetical protein
MGLETFHPTFSFPIFLPNDFGNQTSRNTFIELFSNRCYSNLNSRINLRKDIKHNNFPCLESFMQGMGINSRWKHIHLHATVRCVEKNAEYGKAQSSHAFHTHETTQFFIFQFLLIMT